MSKDIEVGERQLTIFHHPLREPRSIVDVMAEFGFVGAKSTARRLILQGAVRLNGVKVEAIDAIVEPAPFLMLKVGNTYYGDLSA